MGPTADILSSACLSAEKLVRNIPVAEELVKGITTAIDPTAEDIVAALMAEGLTKGWTGTGPVPSVKADSKATGAVLNVKNSGNLLPILSSSSSYSKKYASAETGMGLSADNFAGTCLSKGGPTRSALTEKGPMRGVPVAED